MNADSVQKIAYSLLLRADDDALLIGTTRLVKLFYLIDCEYYRFNGETLTQAPWIFYHYGPYSEELVSTFRTAPDVTVSDLEETGDLKTFRSYRISEHKPDPLRTFSPAIRGIVERVYKTWAPVTLALLLDHVYFETPPMISAVREEPLDFSTIRVVSAIQPEEQVEDYSRLFTTERKRELLSQIRRTSGRTGRARPSWRFNLDENEIAQLEALEASEDIEPPLG
jgi:hypothetical protein